MEKTNSINCVNCGADVSFKPGTHALVCDYCGTANEIPLDKFTVKELDLNKYLKLSQKPKKLEVETIICPGCGANETLDSDKSSSFCAYCGTPLVSGKLQAEEILSPDYLLPFKLDKKEALTKTSQWLRGNWFVPNKLKKDVISYSHFKGVYLPFWTYDANTITYFTGQRGQAYYQEIRRGDKTQRIRRIRWYPAYNDQIAHFFNDILIAGSTSLPKKYLKKLAPWDLKNLVPFKEEYLRGFVTEKFKIGLKEGFIEAKSHMETAIYSMIKRQIGGDEQRIINQKTQFEKLTFKHILLPVYISTFQYKGKKYQFVVNSRTGEVQGKKPLSAGKIALVVIGALIMITILYFISQK